MKVNTMNKDKIEKILNEVQKGYKVRLVSYDDIVRFVKKADIKLKTFCKNYEDCFFTFVEYVKCNTYSKKAYRAYSTYIKVKRGRDNWFLTVCTRLSLPTHRHTVKNFQIILTPKVLKAILMNKLKECDLEENRFLVNEIN